MVAQPCRTDGSISPRLFNKTKNSKQNTHLIYKLLILGAGCLTIVAEDDGVGASKWGLLKAYENEWDGWIPLDFVTRI